MFRFAIMGAGKIAVRFCRAVRQIEDCTIAAVSSKSLERAQAFAAANEIPAFYGNYEEMLEKEKPDAVYIAVLPNDHFRLTQLCLDHHVPVLCEKAMFMNGKEAEITFERSEREKIFVMEALWSRFLPAILQAKEWLDTGRIGTPRLCETVIGFHAPEDPGNRYHDKKLGGGAARDITVYAYELTTWLLRGEIRDETVNVIREETGADLTEVITFKVGSALAVLTATFAVRMEENLCIRADRGKIVIPHPHFASEAFLYDETGQLQEHFKDDGKRDGFTWEIREVMDCVRRQKTESSIVPHSATLACAKLFDRIEKAPD